MTKFGRTWQAWDRKTTLRAGDAIPASWHVWGAVPASLCAGEAVLVTLRAKETVLLILRA